MCFYLYVLHILKGRRHSSFLFFPCPKYTTIRKEFFDNVISQINFISLLTLQFSLGRGRGGAQFWVCYWICCYMYIWRERSNFVFITCAQSIYTTFFTIGYIQIKDERFVKWDPIFWSHFDTSGAKKSSCPFGVNKNIAYWQTENNSPRLTSWSMGVSLQSRRNNIISWWI